MVWELENSAAPIILKGKLTADNYGRDHHPRCFSQWVAGGGFKGGVTYGSTDDFGYNVAENAVDVHDLHATMLHQLGIHHEQLTFKYQGRRFRLTDIKGKSSILWSADPAAWDLVSLTLALPFFMVIMLTGKRSWAREELL